MPRANPDVLLRYPIAVPGLDSNLVREFEHACRGWLDAASVLLAQNRALSAARDLLLPRLIAGRLDIADINLDDLLAVAEG
jgi:hypothetical protein